MIRHFSNVPYQFPPRKVFTFLPCNLQQRNGNVWRYGKSPHLTSKDHLRVWHKRRWKGEMEKEKKGNIFVLLPITFHLMKYATIAKTISKCFEFYNFMLITYVHVIYTLLIMHERWKSSSVFRWLDRRACIAEINKNKIKLQFLLQLCWVSTLAKSLTRIYDIQGPANNIFAITSAKWLYT
jgi:hypothetical protein